MPDRRRRDLLTPLLVALAVILLLAFWVFRPFILVFAVAACVALLLSPEHTPDNNPHPYLEVRR